MLFITANNFAVGWTVCFVHSPACFRERQELSWGEGSCSQLPGWDSWLPLLLTSCVALDKTLSLSVP